MTSTIKAPALFETFADSIAAEVDRMNHAVDRNADGTWPAFQQNDTAEARRYEAIGAKICADQIAGALDNLIHGVIQRDSKPNAPRKGGLHQRLSEIEGKIADVESREKGKSTDEMSDSTLSYLDNLYQQAETAQAMLDAAQALKHAAIGAYLDAAAGTVNAWEPYAMRAQSAPVAPAERADRAARIEAMRKKHRAA